MILDIFPSDKTKQYFYVQDIFRLWNHLHDFRYVQNETAVFTLQDGL